MNLPPLASDAPWLGGALWGSVVYSILIAYWVLRSLRHIFSAGTPRLMKYMSLLLAGVNVICVYLIFGPLLSAFLTSMTIFSTGSFQPGVDMLLNQTVLILRYLASALPYALNMSIVFAALELLTKFSGGIPSGGAVAAAGKLSQRCRQALVITVTATMAFNLLQILLMDGLMSISSQVSIPLLPIIFSVGTLLLGRLIEENRELREDNDMFI